MAKVGEELPQGTFTYIPYSADLEEKRTCGLPKKLETSEWKDKKVVLVGVPGAFTPTCHANHLPGFIDRADELKAKGVDVVAFLAANDVFVMSAWGIQSGARDKVLFLSDGNAAWAKSAGLELDLTAKGFGVRNVRFAAVIDKGVVKYLAKDEGALAETAVDAVLSKL
eukprot:TRINITY_DN651_c0_g1_i1.p1 TRINITY_DN651_c0_g1~~TRINITY_DN651_c0_g1_i1.p1  ORF type:complete len:168 (-),score=50.70 TRINITY_DN651_c0_g1_i1:118-621(-)